MTIFQTFAQQFKNLELVNVRPVPGTNHFYVELANRGEHQMIEVVVEDDVVKPFVFGAKKKK